MTFLGVIYNDMMHWYEEKQMPFIILFVGVTYKSSVIICKTFKNHRILEQ